MDGYTVVTSLQAQRYRPARGGGPLDRVDKLVALDGEIEVDVEGPAAAQRVGCARVRLGDVVRLTGRRAVRSEPVSVRHGHGRQGLFAFARMHLVRSEAERAVRPEDDGAVSPVDLQSVAARIRGSGGHADRDLGAAHHAADDVDAVRRINGNRLVFERATFGNSRRHTRGQLGEFSEDGAQRVDGVPARDGQHVGAVGAYALPDAAGAALQLCLGHGVQICREHVADVALLDQITRVQNRGVAARLQADDGLQRTLASERRHLFRLGEVLAERPFAAHGLPGLEAGHDQLAVTGHAHTDDEQVDVRMRPHVAEPVERVVHTKRSGRGLRGVLARSADRLQLVAGQPFQGGNVRIGAPATPALCHRGSHDSNANLVCHLTSSLGRTDYSNAGAYRPSAPPSRCLRRKSWSSRISFSESSSPSGSGCRSSPAAASYCCSSRLTCSRVARSFATARSTWVRNSWTASAKLDMSGLRWSRRAA